MTLISYKRNYDPELSLSGLFDRFFQDTMNDYSHNRFKPQVDILESEKEYEIQIALPGMEKDDLKLELNENTLTVSGERKLRNESDQKNYHSIETYHGSFSRSFDMPKDVDSNKIEANYKNGILEILIPKNKKAVLKSEIKVK